MVTLEELKLQAMRLSGADRMELAHYIWETLEPETDGIVSDPEWMNEINRRIANMKAGKATLLPGEVLMAELRKAYP